MIQSVVPSMFNLLMGADGSWAAPGFHSDLSIPAILADQAWLLADGAGTGGASGWVLVGGGLLLLLAMSALRKSA